LSLETLKQAGEAVSQPRYIVMLLLLFLIFPVALLRLRKHLYNREGAVDGGTGDEQTLAIPRTALRGVLRCSLLPLYLIAAALMVDELALPVAIGTVVKRVIIHVAIFIWLGRINRFVFGEGGLARRYDLVPVTLCITLQRALTMAAWSYLVFLLPWMIFRAEPFNFISLPRLGYTSFEISVVVILGLLFRHRSPLVRHWMDSRKETKDKPAAVQGRHFLLSNWAWMSTLGLLYLMFIVGLDVLGYRFGAEYLARNTLLSLWAIGMLYLLNRFLLALAGRLIGRRRRIKTSGHPDGQHYESRSLYLHHLRRTLRLVFILLGVVLLSSYWGVNESLFQVLQEYALYSTTGSDGKLAFVTLADLSRFLVSLVVLVWLMRHLPKIFDILYFSRSSMEMGMRYALVTMSRYVVFFIGLFVAFSFLKLNLTQIGWLVAAMSVGLGFGLQEIVANFVSGIILLVERPIRLGDTIILGTEMGTVTRINIRSTTILTPDKHELMIPNKSLITQEVKNWTLQDTKTRLVIGVGVAYSSDVDRVTEALLQLAEEQPEVLKDPKPQALLMLQGPSSLDYELRVYLGEMSHRAILTDRLNKLIIKRFAELDIEIPFPQQDLYVRSLPSPGG
ncbi:MAG: mechanosensitive ion channel, partial [Magnetococcales bacterium]|nr:mechanosensitive ion channel [Magnetococcales bacterium]